MSDIHLLLNVFYIITFFQKSEASGCERDDCCQKGKSENDPNSLLQETNGCHDNKGSNCCQENTAETNINSHCCNKTTLSSKDKLTSMKNSDAVSDGSNIPGLARVFVRTWGCAHNSSDSEYMAGQLAAYGYDIVGKVGSKLPALDISRNIYIKSIIYVNIG